MRRHTLHILCPETDTLGYSHTQAQPQAAMSSGSNPVKSPSSLGSHILPNAPPSHLHSHPHVARLALPSDVHSDSLSLPPATLTLPSSTNLNSRHLLDGQELQHHGPVCWVGLPAAASCSQLIGTQAAMQQQQLRSAQVVDDSGCRTAGGGSGRGSRHVAGNERGRWIGGWTPWC